MFTCRRVAAVVVLSSAVSILSSPTPRGGSVALASDRKETPEFRNRSDAELFESGMKSFNKRDYEGARTDFKKARSGARAKDDRDVVDLWIRAADGGEQLRSIRRFVMSARHREAYDSLVEVYADYRGTPIADEYEKEWTKLSSRVATVVEGFDSHSRYYVKKPERAFIEGESVLRGTQCLEWKNPSGKKASTLALRRVPDDWSEYDEVELWYNARRAPLDMQLVLTCGERGEEDEKASSGEHKLSAGIRMKGKGWQCVRLPLSRFSSRGRPSLTKVRKAELTVEAGRGFDFMLDSISLVKAAEAVARK